MVNAVNWLHTRLTLDGETLDLAQASISQFVRRLDFRSGTMSRSFIWKTKRGRHLRVGFVRFPSMARPNLGCQRIELEALDFSGPVSIALGLDFSPPHESAGGNFWTCLRKGRQSGLRAILAETHGSGQKIFSAFRYVSSFKPSGTTEISTKDPENKFIGVGLRFSLSKGKPLLLDRLVSHHVEKNRNVSAKNVWKSGMKLASGLLKTSFDSERSRQCDYWNEVWKRFDISIEGDPANEQGTRYCIYQMLSTYHGVDPRLNIGAKGLTGEAFGANI